MALNYFAKHKKEDLYRNVQEVYKSDDRPWVIGFSGGKDSTVVAQVIFYALSSMSKGDLTKPVYIISSDTMVENPKVLQHTN